MRRGTLNVLQASQVVAAAAVAVAFVLLILQHSDKNYIQSVQLFVYINTYIQLLNVLVNTAIFSLDNKIAIKLHDRVFE